MTRNLILILEDDIDRIDRFCAALRSLNLQLEPAIWRSARKMVREVDLLLPSARLISLDHDLYPAPGEPEDPGDGLEVAKFLASRQFTCPVIIHSSNADRANMMCGELDLVHCKRKCILPFGSDWIEVHWVAAVRDLLTTT